MKKLISILALVAVLMSTFAIATFATDSPEGNIVVTVPEGDNATYVDATGTEKIVDISAFPVKQEDGTIKLVDLKPFIKVVKVKKIVLADAGTVLKNDSEAISTEWAKKTASKDSIVAVFGDKFNNYKIYSLFQIEFEEEGQKLIGDNKLTAVNAIVETEGLTNANDATLFHYNSASDKFELVKSTVNNNSISLIASLDSDGVGRYGIMYVPTAVSPSTSVNTFMIFGLVAIFALAVVGAVFAGKKIFAKKD